MSRGLGKIQRRVLEVLEYEMKEHNNVKLIVRKVASRVYRGDNSYDESYRRVKEVYELARNEEMDWTEARQIEDDEIDKSIPTESEYQSVMRAIRKLEEKELVRTRKIMGDGNFSFGSNRGGSMYFKEVWLTKFEEQKKDQVIREEKEKVRLWEEDKKNMERIAKKFGYESSYDMLMDKGE